MSSITINNIQITLTATEHNNQYTVIGKNSSGEIISGYTFTPNERPNFTPPSNCIQQLEITQKSGGTLTHTYPGGSLEKTIEVWTNLPKNLNDQSLTDDKGRGTELDIQPGTGTGGK